MKKKTSDFPRNEEFRKVMKRLKLTPADVAAILGKQMRSAGKYGNSTIDGWRYDLRHIPATTLQLFKLLAPSYKRPAAKAKPARR